MKRYEIIFGTLRLPVEFLIVFFSFFIARSIRLVTDLIPRVHLPIKTIATENLIEFALFGSFVFILVFIFSGLYKIKISNSKVKEFFDIIKCLSIWFIFYIAILYLANGYVYSTEIPRLIIFFSLLISFVFIIIERFLINKVIENLLKRGTVERYKVILITKTNELEIINEIKRNFYYDLVGYINKDCIKDMEVPYLGDFKDLKNLIKRGGLDEIYYINSDFSTKQIEEIFEYSRIYGIRYKYLANTFDLIKNNTETLFLGKIPIIEIKSIGLTPWGRVIKRTFDIFSSFMGILILSPLFIFVGLLIKIEDPDGPVIYRNKRVGINGRLFDCFKFRYMKWEFCTKESYGINPEKDSAIKLEKELIEKSSTRNGALYKIKNDPRKTKIGSLIERFSIDELPQLFNVFVGNMSLVGPRPHQPREVDLYKEHQKRVLTIKPGITGMAQVNGRDNNDFDDEVNLDIFYIENWSLVLDFKILLKTIFAIIKR
ncbi:MAG: sugar transferase [Candidatus Gracilibacteria bacterium]|nr:sugar transferase [Candidatus Gracilibacteria bacterium]